MKVLFFGDIFARPGREALVKAISKLKPIYDPEFIVVNAENAAHGNGILPEMVQTFLNLGVDVITTGNHAWDQKKIISFWSQTDRLLRPANYPEHPLHKTPGRGSVIVRSQKNPNVSLGVIQIMGRTFMDAIDCPFIAVDKEIEKIKQQNINCILVDIHGEATSEKQALAHYVDGRVSAALGTHAHVQTADERILPWGTAAITDVGMCGCFDSIIGVKKEISIEKFLTKRKIKYEPADGPGGYGAVLVEINDKTGKALSILRLRETIVSL
ncbi:MAG: YmdB family metallophosphoesterase [Deltaproteobacteria bacterium]|nr:YmdB family metallophosphoesterase [Deltaproteobacteria bacterium]MBI4925526.1 YmdB family metallophosphoesterase [Bdellovibrio sp.]